MAAKKNLAPATKYAPSKDLKIRHHYYYRKSASWASKYVAKTPITPNMLTMAMVLFTIPIFLLLLSTNIWLNIIAILISRVAKFFDYLDGTLAREKNIVSPVGMYLDNMYHTLLNIAIFLPLGLRMYIAGSFELLLVSLTIIFAVQFGHQNYMARALFLKAKDISLSVPNKENKYVRVIHWMYTLPNVYLVWFLCIALVFKFIPAFLIAYCIYALFDSVAKAYVYARY